MGLDTVEIVMEVENTFGIQIPDRDAEKILKVGDFHNYVWEHVKGTKTTIGKTEIRLTRKEVEFIISNIIAEKAGLKLYEVTPEKYIHNDLGID